MPPVLDNVDGGLLRLLERHAAGLLRALQERSVSHVEFESGLLDLLTASSRLLNTELAQRHIDPAREQVELVPCTLAVAQEDEFGVLRRDC